MRLRTHQSFRNKFVDRYSRRRRKVNLKTRRALWSRRHCSVFTFTFGQLKKKRVRCLPKKQRFLIFFFVCFVFFIGGLYSTALLIAFASSVMLMLFKRLDRMGAVNVKPLICFLAVLRNGSSLWKFIFSFEFYKFIFVILQAFQTFCRFLLTLLTCLSFFSVIKLFNRLNS